MSCCSCGTDAIDAVMARDMSFFDEYASGRIVSRVTSDTEDFSNTVTLTLALFSQMLLVCHHHRPCSSTRSADLTLLVLIADARSSSASRSLSARSRAESTQRAAARRRREVNGMIQETMRGIAVAKSLPPGGDDLPRVRGGQRPHIPDPRCKQGFIFSGIFPMLFAIAGLGTTALVWFGGNQVIDGNISAGDWYLFLQAVALFWFPLTSIASFWSQFQQGLSAAERVFALIDAEPRVVQTDDVEPATAGRRDRVPGRRLRLQERAGRCSRISR